MTSTNNIHNTTSQDIEALITSLKEEVALDPSDLVSKISLATILEQSDRNKEAKSVYQEVVDADPTGSMGAIALKALETLKDLPQSGLVEPAKENVESYLEPLFQDNQPQGLPQPKVTSKKQKTPPYSGFTTYQLTASS